MYDFLMKISLTFVPKDSIYNTPVLVQTIALRRPGHKQLSETAMVSLLTHIFVTRPEWVYLMEVRCIPTFHRYDAHALPGVCG